MKFSLTALFKFLYKVFKNNSLNFISNLNWIYVFWNFIFVFHIKEAANLVYKRFESFNENSIVTSKWHTTKIGNNSYNEDWKFICDFGVIFGAIKGDLISFEVKRGS